MIPGVPDTRHLGLLTALRELDAMRRVVLRIGELAPGRGADQARLWLCDIEAEMAAVQQRARDPPLPRRDGRRRGNVAW